MYRNRRDFLQLTGLLVAAMSNINLTAQSLNVVRHAQWWMPEESEAHECTWMSFIASRQIWSTKQAPQVQRDLIKIAQAIAQFEPVKMLVRRQDHAKAAALLGDTNSNSFPISLVEFEMNDLWMRDTGPTFALNAKGQKRAIDFNFNGWGEDQVYDLDAKIAAFVATQAKVKHIRSHLILEGGCFEVDGQGTAIMTKSCILNDNRNPGISKETVEEELKSLLGLKKIIWLNGIKSKDITDGHTDFYARFVRPGLVVVSRDTDPSSYDYKITRENINVLEVATDANHRALDLIVLDTPNIINTRYGTQDFAAGYVGYYVCNGGVIMQKFGDKQADAKAKEQLQQAFPQRRITQISVDAIASGGGSIHCTTQQEPTHEIMNG